MARKKPDENPKPSSALRQRAEALLRASPDDTPTMPTEDVQALVHELNVHQMELEIQNEELREAQVELSHTRDRFADLYEFAPVGYVTLDKNASILEANLTAATMLGVDRQDLLKSRMSKFVIRDSQDDCYLHLQAVFAGNEKRTTEIEMHKADGTPLAVRLESIAFDVEGQRWCRTALIDITATRTAQQQLAASEQRYRRLTDAVIDYIFTVRVENDGEAKTIHGPNCEAITGYTPDEFASNDLLWICIVPEEDRPLVEHHIREILAGVRPAPLEHRIRRKDGAIRWVLRVTSPHLNEQGRPIAYDGLLRDITEHKRAEQVVRESEQFTRRVLNNLFAFVGVLELDGTLIEANEAPLQAAGISRDEVVGRKFWDCFWWNYSTEVQDQLRDAWRRAGRGELVRYDVPVRIAGDTRMMIDFQLAPLRNAQGEITHLIPSAMDITDRKAAEEAIQRLNEELEDRMAQRTDELLASDTELAATGQRLKNLLDNVDVIVSDWQMPSMTPTFVSQRAEDILGYPLDDWMRPGFWNTVLLHPDGRDEAVQFCAQETQAGRDHEFVYRARHADGRTVWIHEFVTVVGGKSGETSNLTCVMVDITERKQAEQALRASHERLKKVLEVETVGVMFWDLTTGCMTDANDTFLNLMGYRRSEVEAGELTWQKLTPPEYVDASLAEIRKFQETGRVGPYEKEYLRKDGTRQWFVFAGSSLGDNTCVEFCVDIGERKKLQRDVVDVAEDEQRRIGQDLHDGTQQELAGLGMLAQTLLDNLAKETAGLSKTSTKAYQELAKKIVDGITRTHREVQTVSRGLVPIRLDPEGLMDALRELASRTDELDGVACAFKCEQPVQVGDSLTATHLYRIAQEALTNSLKHARPEHILIALDTNNGQPILQVADDGIGFGSAEQSEGMGLKTMHYRASLIRANLTISPVEAGGTLVTCKVFGGGG